MNEFIAPGKDGSGEAQDNDKLNSSVEPFQVELGPLQDPDQYQDQEINNHSVRNDNIWGFAKKHHRGLILTGLIAGASLFAISYKDTPTTATSLPSSSLASSQSAPNVPSNSTPVTTMFHQSGFGGIRNIAHPAGARVHRNRLLSGEGGNENVIIPVSAVKHAIPSLAPENIINLHGHYVHDEHHSPFSSFLYDRPQEELEAEQTAYLQKMENVRNKWGAWDFHDDANVIRPIANFDSTEYKDMPNSKFPEKSWQMDETYVKSLIGEGRKLIDRIREGIYAEYGHPTEGLTGAEIEERNELFKVHIADTAPKGPGMAWITKKGFDMLSRKLIHSMITNDEL